MKNYELRYNAPAPFGNENLFQYDHKNPHNIPDDGWEKWSLPVGNGFFGASIFGRTETERIQLTENSFANPMNTENCGAGLNNLAEIYIERSSPAAYTSLTTVASTPSLSVPTIISISTNSSTGNVTKMTASQYLIHFIMCGQFVLFMLIPGILRELHFDKFTLWKLHFCNHPV